jgi:peptide/nickel transport system ATP-binding protein
LLPLIKIKNLIVDFPGTENQNIALDNFNLELNLGEMLAVVGESGSGKSVMALALMRLLSSSARIRSGSIIFSPDGEQTTDLLAISEKKFRSFRGNHLSMIFQEPMSSLNPLMPCGEQLIEPLMLHKRVNRSAAKKEAIRLFEKVELPEPENICNRFPHQLSGGQRQRVMISMAISCKPSLLICDEPTTALDVRVQRKILDLLKGLCRSENMGMLFITHDLGLVADMADRALVMMRGKVIESGSVSEIFNKPRHAYTRGLLMCRPLLYKKGQRLPTISDFIGDGEDRGSEYMERPSAKYEPKNQGPLFISVKNLGIRYGNAKNWIGRYKNYTYPVENVNFDVYRGETLGIVGESGSGKTSVGRALLGLNKPFTGSISYGQTELLTLRKRDLIDFRKNIQIVFQDPYSSLNPRLMIGPAIAEPYKVHRQLGLLERKNLVEGWLKKVDLKPEHYYRYPHEFSGGQRQRIVIARALVLNPGLVVFDESVSALDVSIQAQVLNLINDLKRDLGFTAVFISHDLSVIRYLCDRVLVMEKGRIVESGITENIYQNPQTNYTRSLIDSLPGAKPKSGLSSAR